MTSYYNENDPFAAQWLRNLIAKKLIPEGDVDDRSIEDVRPDDLAGYRQCHFFAGIAGWPLALALAGWPEDREVWTGSPPCQDYSVGGAVWGVRAGITGNRGRLTQTWANLVCRVRPRVVFFENVPGAAQWIAPIESSLEAIGYAISRQVISAAAVGAPHLRRRLWMVADRDGTRLQERRPPGPQTAPGEPWRTAPGNYWRTTPGGDRVLADGIPRRVDAVRAYGNAIVPQVAAEFITAFTETQGI